MKEKFRNAVARFHHDEAGNETVQTVMILAFAAMIMMGLYWIWKEAQVGPGEGGLLGSIVHLLNEALNLDFTGG
jgi:hypothetical protein